VLFGNNPLIPELLRSCIEVTAANFGNVQLFDSSRRSLRIVAQEGFGSEFLEYFQTVCSGIFSCGEAMNQRSRVIVPDVARDLLFQDKRTRDVMHRANVHACQSTPLVASSGEFIGVVSTHFDRPRKFSSKVLKDVDALVEPMVKEIASAVMIPKT
jgi:GAF domain-containing protein